MFNKETVFILGAGASWHYGYPTGEELVKRVIAKAEQVGAYCKRVADGNLKHSAIMATLPRYVLPRDAGTHFPVYWNRVFHECRHLSVALQEAKPLVIDYFLGHNEEHRRIGKLMIAWVITDCEAASLYFKGNCNRVSWLSAGPLEPEWVHETRFVTPDGIESRADLEKKLGQYKDAWYRFILDKLTTGCSESSMLLSNKVTFVTFNYDVSLEFHLYHGLKHYQTFNTTDIDRFFENQRIVHVYGSVRNYPSAGYDRPPVVDFEADFPHYRNDIEKLIDNHAKVVELMNRAEEESKNLRTIDQVDKDDNVTAFEHAQHAIADAKCVYILGYGFDPENSKRLRLNAYLLANAPNRKSVMFTNYGDSNRINKHASKLLLGKIGRFLGDDSIIGEPDNEHYYFEKSTRDVYGALELDFFPLEE